MFNIQKSLLILSFSITTLIAMKNDKTIIPTKKSIFTPTANTPQANEELLEIINNTKKFQEKDWENIKKCLKNGADPNLKFGTFLNTPLCLAIQYNRKDLFDYLLQLGADINIQDGCQWTPLHTFILIRPTNFCIEDLLKNGANTNTITFKGSTPLFSASEKGHLDFIKPLIQYNADINQKGMGGITSLGSTIKMENLEAIKQLCSAGASPINIDNYYNNTAFHIAANKSEKVIETLITHINIKNNNNDLTNIIKTVLLVFHRFKNDRKSNIFNIPQIPYDIQIFILSKLLSVDSFHQGLYKQCKGERYYNLHLELVNNHIEYLKKILQIKNRENKTALELLLKTQNFPMVNAILNMHGIKTKTELLLEGTTLQEDLDTFNEKYPDIASISADNLARQILENHYTFEPK